MTTDISVFTQQLQVEDRSWDLTPPDGGYVVNGTIDVASLTAADHYPNGYLPSGTVLGKITASGKWGPYNNAATDGTETAVAVLKSSVRIRRSDGSTPAAVGAAGLVHGVIATARLPIASGKAGAWDTAAATDLRLIYVAG